MLSKKIATSTFLLMTGRKQRRVVTRSSVLTAVREEEKVAKPGSDLKEWVPTGKFTMGSPEGEKGRSYNEVTIAQPFGVGKTDVTLAEWDACVA
jgi:formylglycine-generating enzyme required for sulfatase activity